jgi:hypothetical protein
MTLDSEHGNTTPTHCHYHFIEQVASRPRWGRALGRRGVGAPGHKTATREASDCVAWSSEEIGLEEGQLSTAGSPATTQARAAPWRRCCRARECECVARRRRARGRRVRVAPLSWPWPARASRAVALDVAATKEMGKAEVTGGEMSTPQRTSEPFMRSNELCPQEIDCPVRLAYQPLASSTFLSEQTIHQQPINSTFLSEHISTSHQPPAKRTNEQAVPRCFLRAMREKATCTAAARLTSEP